MSIINRSCFIHPVLRKITFSPLEHVRTVTLKPTIAGNTATLPFHKRNEILQRPLSPHLTIYKPQMTAILSITHRITGMALGGYLAVIAAVVISPYDAFNVIDFIKSLHLSPLTSIAIKSIIAYPFAYHFAGGIRHLIWDSGKLLTNSGVIKSGYTVLLASVILTAIIVNL